MPKNLRWKFLFIAAIMVVSLALFLSPKESGAGLLSRLNLGLDLKGGIHLVLRVVTEEALDQEISQDAQRIADELKERNLPFESALKGKGLTIDIKGVNAAQDREVRNYLNPLFDKKYTIRSTTTGGKSDYSLTMMPSVVRQMQESTVNMALGTIDRRVNALGVTEPTLQIYGGGSGEVDDQIIVELPGIDDRERVKELIGTTAQLNLRLVKKENGGPFSSVDSAIQANGGKIPEGWKILGYRGDQSEQTSVEYLVVSSAPAITGKHLKDARRGVDSNGRPAVSFFLNAAGAEIFSKTTEQHVGDRLAIELDDIVESAPVIQTRIGADGEITGNFTIQKAEDLALLLRSGALPASLNVIEDRTVGASLGNDAIRSGIISALIGFGLVVIGMIIYYKHAGLNAIWCLVANVIILMGFMGAVGATLTLPGIAGIILTIGMSVDSNILVFERIKEELRNGKTIRAAIDYGFSRVFWTIVDTHLCTLVSALFLFQFGTGPIRGFAVTLIVGLVANMFTAIYVSHRLFDLTLSRRKLESLSI